MGLLFQAFPPDGRSQKLPSTTKITKSKRQSYYKIVKFALQIHVTTPEDGGLGIRFAPLFEARTGRYERQAPLTSEKHFASQSVSRCRKR